MEACTWDLEPEFTHQHEGKTINVVLTTVVYQPGHHLCKTLLREQQGLTDCILQRGHPRHTVLQGVLQRRNGQWWITMSHDTRTFCRPDPEMSGLYRVVDACSGIGAVATGFEQTGAEIICHVEGNEQFCQWKSSRSSVPCIRGDVNHVQTIHAVAKHTQWSHTLSAGISCQPFSKLGDERQEKDPRSASLPGTLLMGYFLGSMQSFWNVPKKRASQIGSKTNYKLLQVRLGSQCNRLYSCYMKHGQLVEPDGGQS